MKKIMFNDALGLTAAVLSGRKTMTRRVVSFSETDAAIFDSLTDAEREAMIPVVIDRYSLYQVGDEVAIAQCYKDLGLPPDLRVSKRIRLKSGHHAHEFGPISERPGWTNKMFVKASLMPHRIRITDVQLQRLQDISSGDCLSEGIQMGLFELRGPIPCYYFYGHKFKYTEATRAFSVLINMVSKKDLWKENPWVFVYTFKLIK